MITFLSRKGREEGGREEKKKNMEEGIT